MIEIKIDGLCEPKNPGGVATYGVIMRRDGKIISEERGVAGAGPSFSNNVGEYAALVHALRTMIIFKNYPDDVVIKSDSQLVVKQMRREWQCHGGMYLETKQEAERLLSKIPNKITYEWIPREQNTEADELSRSAYESYCRSHGLEILYMKSEKHPITTFYETPSKQVIKEVKSQEKCKDCHWIRYVGPHVGCFYNGKYKKWLSKKFVETSKCELFKKLDPRGEKSEQEEIDAYITENLGSTDTDYRDDVKQ